MSLMSMLSGRMVVVPPEIIIQPGSIPDYSWNSTGQEYPCDVQPIETGKQVQLSAISIDATHVVYFNPRQIELKVSDRLLIADKLYAVQSLEFPRSQRAQWPAMAMVREARL